MPKESEVIEDGKAWDRYSADEPYRERWRCRQLDLVHGMKVLASGELLDVELHGDPGCSCTEWVMELATMVEELHRRLDKVPGMTR